MINNPLHYILLFLTSWWTLKNASGFEDHIETTLTPLHINLSFKFSPNNRAALGEYIFRPGTLAITRHRRGPANGYSHHSISKDCCQDELAPLPSSSLIPPSALDVGTQWWVYLAAKGKLSAEGITGCSNSPKPRSNIWPVSGFWVGACATSGQEKKIQATFSFSTTLAL